MVEILMTGIQKHFHQKKVLDIPSFLASEGEIISIVGENGAGKSTFIKLIAGIFLQDQGEVSVYGLSNRSKAIHSMVRFVLESGQGLYSYLTAMENLHYFLSLNQLTVNDLQQELDFLFEAFEFTPYKDILVAELSQGNRQKLSLILALVQKPRVLCLDEPTNGLDFHAKNQLVSLLKDEVTNRKMTVFMTSHDAHFIEKVSGRIVVMNKGNIQKEGTFQELFGENSHKESYKLVLPIQVEDFLHMHYPKLSYEITGEQLFLEIRDEQLAHFLLEHTEVLQFFREPVSIEDLLYEGLKLC